MTCSPRPVRRWLAASAVAAALLTSACSPGGGETETDDAESPVPENPLPEPEYEGDDTIRLPVAMVSPAGHSERAPIGEDGTLESDLAPGAQLDNTGVSQPHPHMTEIARTGTFGCGDTISVVQTVPMVTDDAASAALGFLLQDQLYSHGDPAFINALAVSADSLELDSVSVDGDTVTVQLSGEAVTRSYCEAWQALKQVETTAIVATGTRSANVLLNGEPMAAHLGVDDDGTPLEIIQIQRDD
ncbi:hypothetical protein [Nesterenkonia flava]|uniref:GerMN domain-containing protein n=1 Tax=Nesterenkonia flava TaxID=469799 RepID=A0ABU1FW48_9MICC|nr:hypothetical protein [Nesterenkonia flava]MDR5712368.1 hypothetical protein [Nesterenkonia flava]